MRDQFNDKLNLREIKLVTKSFDDYEQKIFEELFGNNIFEDLYGDSCNEIVSLLYAFLIEFKILIYCC